MHLPLKCLRQQCLVAFRVTFVAGVLAFGSANAATLAPDPSFRPPSFAEPVPAARNLLLPDGKYLVFSRPNTLTDQPAGAITRYLADGTLDTTFHFTRLYKNVAALALAPDNKLYVAATRYTYGRREAEEILRLNSDGSIDASFTRTIITSDIPGNVQQIRLQPDGKILVAGFIASGVGAGDGIFRLFPDGTKDPNFAAVQVDGFVMSSALQPDGKVLIAGSFTVVNGAAHRGVVRLNSDGSIDTSFHANGYTLSQSIRALTVLDDGKILMAGHFRVETGLLPPPRAPLVKLNTDGTLDTTFSSANIPSLSLARDFVVLSDGKIVATINNSVYRFNPNGSRDYSFRQPVFVSTQFTPTGDPGSPASLQLLSDGRLLVGGTFSDVDPAGAPTGANFGVARLFPDGTLDSTLTTKHKTGVETAPNTFARLPDGSTLVGFALGIDPPIPFNIGRLLPDGARDLNFTLSSSNPDSFLSGGFIARGFEPLPDGTFFVFGTKADSSPSFGKVSSSGAEVPGFAPSSVVPIQKAIALPNGKLLLSGGTDPQAALYATLFRILPNGEVDDAFLPDGRIHSFQIDRDGNNGLRRMHVGTRILALLNDGRTLFEYLASDGFFHLVLLDIYGSFDSEFTPTTFVPFDQNLSFPVVFDPEWGVPVQPYDGVLTASLPLLDAYVQADGRIVLAGQFKSYRGIPARGLVRINPDGTVDSSFNIGGGAQWTDTAETATAFPKVENIQPQPDGKLLITGTFEAFNGIPAPGIASLNPDGSVDTSFVAPVARDKHSRVAAALERQTDGTFLLSGPYRFSNEAEVTSLIRLVGPARAGNISTRLEVGTGDNALIEGFIVQGPAGSTKKILVRAIGPSLSPFGVTDALANPTLEIRNESNAIVATNNDWKTTQTGGLITGDQVAEITASQLAPGNDLESAIIADLPPGSYTAVVRGSGNSTGTAVVDAFDLSAASPARLANIATRGLIQPGDKLMIAGFIVQNGPAKVVVTAIGPSLKGFGISNALPDTTLELRDQNGGIVVANDDWKTGQRQELEGTGLQPTNDLEAALITTIQPGQYTAQVRGKGQDSGIGVVQVYFLQ